ncbi:MAG: hypothetical protein OXP69_04055 [Spirochaetaceae bacterium]|nr:hypothetical protein [Spirochaetaceae bacterium]MDE0445169.1 hypothetical protein [Spirochaetaceae bacterium]
MLAHVSHLLLAEDALREAAAAEAGDRGLGATLHGNSCAPAHGQPLALPELCEQLPAPRRSAGPEVP